MRKRRGESKRKGRKGRRRTKGEEGRTKERVGAEERIDDGEAKVEVEGRKGKERLE